MDPKLIISYRKEGIELEKDRVFDAVETWSEVSYLDPEIDHPEILNESYRKYDLYHMAKTRDPSLRDLERAEKNNIKTINPYKGARLVDDRYESLKLIEMFGVKIPKTYYGRHEDIELGYPLVSKPRFEGQGHLFDILEKPYIGEKLVQEIINYDESLKIYKVGENNRCIRMVGINPFDRDYTSTEEVKVESYMEDIVDRIHQATGLKLFEVDVLQNEEGNFVVDVNSMVGLQNVSDAVDIYNELLWKESKFGRKKSGFLRNCIRSKDKN